MNDRLLSINGMCHVSAMVTILQMIWDRGLR